ncbi:MAG: NupC/NupG family nucleoside CNT transporter, partial [Deltaproteobacteria bacterium]|nr:NupC/NupG family nucleoside CNT transporter [Deltaproteobacteria bacterium]
MIAERAVSALGLVVLIAIAWALSSDRRKVSWRIVFWGLGIQFGLAVLLLKTPVGRPFFDGMNALARALMGFTDVGARFVFGSLADTGFSFVVNVLPIIIVMGSVFAVLYHVGIMQRVVDGLSALLSRTM